MSSIDPGKFQLQTISVRRDVCAHIHSFGVLLPFTLNLAERDDPEDEKYTYVTHYPLPLCVAP